MTLTQSKFVDPNELRAAFCSALSDMYRQEVPLYGDLVSLVDEVNSKVTTASPGLWEVGGELFLLLQYHWADLRMLYRSSPS